MGASEAAKGEGRGCKREGRALRLGLPRGVALVERGVALAGAAAGANGLEAAAVPPVGCPPGRTRPAEPTRRNGERCGDHRCGAS